MSTNRPAGDNEIKITKSELQNFLAQTRADAVRARFLTQDQKPAKPAKLKALWNGLFGVQVWRALKKRVLRSLNSADPLGFTPDVPLGKRELKEQLHTAKRSQSLRLRRTIAKWAVFFVALQLICSNWFFLRFLEANGYVIQPPIMIAWLSACVIEVIGILLVIARSLFPRRDRDKCDKDKCDACKADATK